MMVDLKSIKDFTDIVEFTYLGCDYKKDSRAKESLNKTLETAYKAVYRQEASYKRQWKSDNISWDSETFFVLTASGKLLCFTNSEWGGALAAK